MTENLNLLKEFVKNQEKQFTQEIVNDTLNYQKKYGFKIGENNIAHNNESDAFRHTYMQALLATRYHNILAKWAGDRHEKQGINRGQDSKEENMDLWNNNQGREIANEVYKEYPNFKSFPEQTQKDIIAKKVFERMQSGKLITDLEDTRKYREMQQNITYAPMRNIGGSPKNSKSAGFASDLDNYELAKKFGLKSVLRQEDYPKEPELFTREQIGAMTCEEFKRNEKAIMKQLRERGIPYARDLKQKSQKQNAKSSKSSDGKWVTINGNHVLIKD